MFGLGWGDGEKNAVKLPSRISQDSEPGHGAHREQRMDWILII